MTAVQEPGAYEVEVEQEPRYGSGNSRRGFAVLASLLVAALVGFGIGWLVFDDSGGGATSTIGDFPTGYFAHESNEFQYFRFAEDGTYVFSEAGVGVTGKFGINGDLYTEMTHDSPGEAQVPATYTWTFDGERLTFELVGEDYLSHRKNVAYDGQTYILSE